MHGWVDGFGLGSHLHFHSLDVKQVRMPNKSITGRQSSVKSMYVGPELCKPTMPDSCGIGHIIHHLVYGRDV